MPKLPMKRKVAFQSTPVQLSKIKSSEVKSIVHVCGSLSLSLSLSETFSHILR